MIRTLALLFLMLLAAAPGGMAPDAAQRAFLAHLQRAVREGRRDALLARIDYPLRVNRPGQPSRYYGAASARVNFGRIFTPAVRAAVLRQRPEDLFVSSRGVMIGNGEIWFDHTCPRNRCEPPGPVKIKAINLF
jgi:hypothetical protein